MTQIDVTAAGGPGPRARTAVSGIDVYEGGRSTEDVRRDLGFDGRLALLASNENPFEPLPAVLRALAAGEGQSNRYPDFTARAVRDALSEHLGGVPPDQIMVGCGSANVMQQVFFTYVEPGDEVIFPWPGFGGHPLFTKMCGGIPIAVGLRDQTVDLDGLLARVTDQTRLIGVTNPNNPTSTAVSGKALQDFLNQVPESVLVVLDEAYIEYARSTTERETVAEALQRPNVVVLRTFSKAFGLASLRIGYAIGPVEVITDARRTGFPFPVNAMAQAAALAALREIAQVRQQVAYVVKERDRLTANLRADGWSVADSEANFLWLPMEGRSREIATFLELERVVTRPFEDGLRITVGLKGDNDLFLSAFENLVPGPDRRVTDPVGRYELDDDREVPRQPHLAGGIL
jgi:histidinol-phosphate aminotransferase